MTKKDWLNLYEKLNAIYYEFIIAYSDYQNGKNDKVRRDGNDKSHIYIDKAISILSSNEECYRLIFNNQEFNSLRESIILEDFKKPQYFDKDMNFILEKIHQLT